MTVPVWELALRATILFTFIFMVFRLWGKKHFGELAPFDFVLLLIISEGVQSAMVAGDESIPASFIVILTLTALNTVLSRLSIKSKRMQHIIEGSPVMLINRGKVLWDNLEQESISKEELYETLRDHGLVDVEKVFLAVLETDGKVTLVRDEDVLESSRKTMRGITND